MVTAFGPHCRRKTYGPGQPDGSAFTESGTTPLEVRNLSSTKSAAVLATLIAPNCDVDIFRCGRRSPLHVIVDVQVVRSARADWTMVE